jgi:hypothetical protein
MRADTLLVRDWEEDRAPGCVTRMRSDTSDRWSTVRLVRLVRLAFIEMVEESPWRGDDETGGAVAEGVSLRGESCAPCDEYALGRPL